MVVPIIIMALAGVIILAVVILGMTDWFELMFLAAIAALMMAMYKNVI